MVAAIGSFAAGPATARREPANGRQVFGVVQGFDDEISLVGDELGVQAEPGANGLIDLRGGVVVGLEAADGSFNQRAEVGDIAGGGGEDQASRPMCGVDMLILTSIP
jgi:hypothetical protein